jgi:hypothetical protein
MRIFILFFLTIFFAALAAGNPVFLPFYAICMAALIFSVIAYVVGKVGGIIDNMIYGADNSKE